MGKTYSQINKYAIKRNERPEPEFFSRKAGPHKHKLDKRQQNKMLREMDEQYE